METGLFAFNRMRREKERKKKELEEHRADVLGDGEGEGQEASGNLSEEEFRELKADQQKEIVEELGGDLSELTNEDKRAAFYLENVKG